MTEGPTPLSLDEHLDELVANIVKRLRFDPPAVGELLLPPRTRIVKSSGSDYKSFTIWAGSQATIRMGGASWSMLSALTRAAAAYFVADETGVKPSSYWPVARDALAAAIDWYASPSQTRRIRQFPVSSRQNVAATAFAQYAYRFVICHELAHIALEHRNDLVGLAPQEEVTSLRAAQDQEIDADSFGLQMQIRSLPDPAQLVTALASPMYFVYLLRAFDDYRLAMLSELVDEKAWKIEYSHPPYLHRIWALSGTAGFLSGENARTGLVEKVHGGLANVVGKVWEAASDTRDKVAKRAAKVLTSTNKNAPPALAALLDTSPIGVLQAMDADSDRSWARDGWRFAEVVPSEFTEFLNLDRFGRSQLLA